MNRSFALRPAALAVALVVGGWALALAAPRTAVAGDPCFHGYAIPSATTADTDAVRMEPCAFVPTNARVAVGRTVTFTNTSGEVHLLAGANQAWGDREREILPGEKVAVTFDEPGIFAFSCSLHAGMSGAVIVENADGASEAAAVAGASGATDGGAALPAALAIVAALAAIGWAIALVQHRRLATVAVQVAAPATPAIPRASAVAAGVEGARRP